MTSEISRRGLLLTSAVFAGLAPISGFATAYKPMFMTYDDGPDDHHTGPLLDVLDLYGMKATFFVIGQKVQRRPDLVMEIFKRGHTVGNHSWSHPDMGKWGLDKVLSQVDRTNRAIEDATGIKPHLFRPPYGSFTPALRKGLAKERGMKTVLWDVDTHDWQRPGAKVVADRVIAGARPNKIILMHDIQPDTLKSSEMALSGLLYDGYQSFAMT